jgi:microsomal epoxide hydrolase
MRSALLQIALLLALSGQARAADRFFTTSDGVRLHYIEQGQGHTIVLVPGWTMPAWIFDQQIADFSRHYHVIAFDPRSQGDSDIAPSGHEPYRRGRDIEELLEHINDPAPLLVGWSLGVLDVLSYIHQFSDAHIAGLVLIDNSVGAGPPPTAHPPPRTTAHHRRVRPRPALSRETIMRMFVRAMFRTPQTPDYIDRLTDAALRTPPAAAAALRAYNVPRSFWKDAVDETDKPILYVVTPRLQQQAAILAGTHPDTESYVLRNVGHALFVDAPGQFDALVENFIHRRVWH